MSTKEHEISNKNFLAIYTYSVNERKRVSVRACYTYVFLTFLETANV